VSATALWAAVQTARDIEAEAALAWGLAAFDGADAWLVAGDAWAVARASLDAAEAAFGRAVDAEAGLLAA
jgi:hypothetical protein